MFEEIVLGAVIYFSAIWIACYVIVGIKIEQAVINENLSIQKAVHLVNGFSLPLKYFIEEMYFSIRQHHNTTLSQRIKAASLPRIMSYYFYVIISLFLGFYGLLSQLNILFIKIGWGVISVITIVYFTWWKVQRD